MNPHRRIDAHQHLWHCDAKEYSWIVDEMAVLRRDYLPAHLASVMRSANVDASIVTPARQCVEESCFLMECADAFPGICGVVGWVPLTEPEPLERALDRFCADPRFVGIREIAQGEAAGFLDRPEFREGIARLVERDLAYGVIIFADQLPEATRLVDAFPEQQFVLDHCAKPNIAAQLLDSWSDHLRELAKRSNVVCKLSSMMTEAPWNDWSATALRTYFDVCVESFTPARLIAGSDWLVCLLACCASPKLHLDRKWPSLNG